MAWRVWDGVGDGGPHCLAVVYHGESTVSPKVSVCDVTNTISVVTEPRWSLIIILRKELVRRYVVTVPVAPLVRFFIR